MARYSMCPQTIQGNPDSRVSSLVWCASSKSNPSGRLFSSSIDGSISEWGLFSLKQKGLSLLTVLSNCSLYFSLQKSQDTGDDGGDESSGSQANMVTHMNRGKRSRHACVVAAALAQATPAQPQVTQSSRAKNTLEGAAQATPAQPQVTRSSLADST